MLARDADPWADPVLVLRAAGAAARADLPLAPHALDRLATESAPVPSPWPADARDAFVDLLGTGHRAVPVLEALDQAGLLVRLIPEWARVRSHPQRNPVHRFTVDRHLIEAAAEAAALTRTVARPDLLLLGAFLHDIGKGFPGDHTDAGVAVVRELGPRLGLPYGDAATIVAMVRHHLLLPDTATRRDLADPMTVRTVVEAVDGSARPARPAARAGDRRRIGHRAGGLDGLEGRPGGRAGRPGPGRGCGTAASRRSRRRCSTAGQRELAASSPGEVAVRVDGDSVTVAAPDRPGLLSRTAGVLALHQLDVRAASAVTVGPTAVDVFTVSPRFGAGPDPALLRADVARALAGTLPLADRLAAKEAAYGSGPQQPPRVLWFDGAATDATVLELRAADAAGLLHRVTAALERCRLDVRGARVSTPRRRRGRRLLRRRRGRRPGDGPGRAPGRHRGRAHCRWYVGVMIARASVWNSSVERGEGRGRVLVDAERARRRARARRRRTGATRRRAAGPRRPTAAGRSRRGRGRRPPAGDVVLCRRRWPAR